MQTYTYGFVLRLIGMIFLVSPAYANGVAPEQPAWSGGPAQVPAGEKPDLDSRFAALGDLLESLPGNGGNWSGHPGDHEPLHFLTSLPARERATILRESLEAYPPAELKDSWREFGENGIYVDASPVPIPAAIWLFVSALGLLGCRRLWGNRQKP
jgi:hypothetical protein